eukprot:7954542-Pyramimonas_sp.AAC.1
MLGAGANHARGGGMPGLGRARAVASMRLPVRVVVRVVGEGCEDLNHDIMPNRFVSAGAPGEYAR